MKLLWRSLSLSLFSPLSPSRLILTTPKVSSRCLINFPTYCSTPSLEQPPSRLRDCSNLVKPKAVSTASRGRALSKASSKAVTPKAFSNAATSSPTFWSRPSGAEAPMQVAVFVLVLRERRADCDGAEGEMS